MKRVKISAIICLIWILSYGCSGFLLRQPRQQLPLDKKLIITEHEKDSKQHLFLTLHDSADNVIYAHQKIKPDSIICYIDGGISTPTLEINKIYIEHTEYRYYDQELQRHGLYPPGTHSPRERYATINYQVPIRIYRFTFPNKQLFELWIPEKLREKAYLKSSPRGQPSREQQQESIKDSHDLPR